MSGRIVSEISTAMTERTHCIIPGKAGGNTSVGGSIALLNWRGNCDCRGKGAQCKDLDRECHRGLMVDVGREWVMMEELVNLRKSRGCRNVLRYIRNRFNEGAPLSRQWNGTLLCEESSKK